MQSRLNSAVMLILILIFAGLLAWLSTRYPLVLDWTRSGTHTLSDASKEVLALMTDEIEITAYAREDQELRTAIEKIVNRYQRIKPDIVLHFVNPDAVPDEVRNLGITVDGELIVRYRQRSEHIKSGNEEEFTNALHRLLRGKQHWLSFIEGHGERKPLGEANHDLGQWVNHLKGSGYHAQPINLGEVQAIPDNTKILVIAGPRVDILPGEVALIDNYLSNGGNLLWLLDPGTLRGLESIADSLNIQIPEGVIIDFAGRLIGVNDPTITLATPSMYANHSALQGLDFTTLFPTITSIDLVDKDSGWQIAELIETGDHTWQETGELEGEVNFDKEVEKAGPLTIALALERDLVSDAEDTVTGQQRIVVIGDGDFLSNAYLANGGNLELGMRVINWLSNDDEIINIPPRIKEDTSLEFSTAASLMIGFGFLIVLPLVFITCGIIIWWRRKKS